jgi:hypothetical protein
MVKIETRLHVNQSSDGNYAISSEPFFAIIGLFLRERKINQLSVTILHSMKLFEMLIEVVEIDLCIFSSTRSQTLHIRKSHIDLQPCSI